MAVTKKKSTGKVAKRKVLITKTHPTKEEFERATTMALKQYRTAVKKLARR